MCSILTQVARGALWRYIRRVAFQAATSASWPTFFEACRYEYRHGRLKARSTARFSKSLLEPAQPLGEHFVIYTHPHPKTLRRPEEAPRHGRGLTLGAQPGQKLGGIGGRQSQKRSGPPLRPH